MIKYTEEFLEAMKALDEAHQRICCTKSFDKFDTKTAELINAAYEVHHLFECHAIEGGDK